MTADGLCPDCRTAVLPPGRNCCHACGSLAAMQRADELRDLRAIMTEPPRPGRGQEED